MGIHSEKVTPSTDDSSVLQHHMLTVEFGNTFPTISLRRFKQKVHGASTSVVLSNNLSSQIVLDVAVIAHFLGIISRAQGRLPKKRLKIK